MKLPIRETEKLHRKRLRGILEELWADSGTTHYQAAVEDGFEGSFEDWIDSKIPDQAFLEATIDARVLLILQQYGLIIL